MQAVIFDYGNVLCQPQPAAEVAAMASMLNLGRDHFEQIYWRHRLAYDEGRLDRLEYWQNFGSVTAAQVEELDRIDGLSWTHPDAAIADWARQLSKSGFRIALLSNMPFSVRDAVLGCSWLPEFEQRTFSCELGISKPAPEIYRHCLTELGVAARDVLFLDDRPANVEGAKQAGMQGIVFSSTDALAGELRRFDIPPPATLKKGDGRDEKDQ